MGRGKRRKKPQPREPEKKGWGVEAFLFVLAFALRALHLWIYGDDFWLKTPLLDDNIFASWADIIAKEGFLARSLGAFDFNPAYPYLLVLLRKIALGYGVLGVFLIQHSVGALVPVLVYKLTQQVFSDNTTALVAGLLAAFYGPSFFYESRYLGEFWIFFFNAACLCALVFADRESPSFWVWAAAGISLGFSNLFRPNVLVFVPFVLAWGFWCFRLHLADEGRPVRAQNAVLGCLVFLLTLWLPLLPFQLRNRAVVEGAGWGLTTASGGVNLYLGNNPEADGLNLAPSFIRYGPGHEYADFKEEAQRRTGTTLTKKEVSRYWTAQVLEWFKTQPGLAFSLMLRKAGFFWNHREPPDNFFLSIFEKFTTLGGWPLIAWGLVAPLGLAGFLWSLALGPGRRYWILHAYVFSYFAVNVLFYILSRYRFPTAVGLIPFAAFALVEAKRVVSARSGFKTLALGILIAASVGFSRVPMIGDEDKAVSHYSMAVIYANQGWKEKAVAEYHKSIAANPAFKASYVNLGILEAGRGHLPEALRALEGALPFETEPKQVEALKSNIEALKRKIGGMR
ncbi:MAG: hypothetical protein COB53_05825 [Elusimicrobia bacterium]|nr:MAG: hypothetical protein COB53_05825 [Elusimicrobiota bacterium]